jgi:hypothetical protein
VAAECVNTISHNTWATYAFVHSRFGHLTSNLSESINMAWGDLRHYSILKLLDTIWTRMMQTFYQRYNSPQKKSVLCDVPYSIFQERLKQSQRYYVVQLRIGICQV